VSLKTMMRRLFPRTALRQSGAVFPIAPIVEEARREGWTMTPAKQAAEWTDEIAATNLAIKLADRAKRFALYNDLASGRRATAPYFINRRLNGKTLNDRDGEVSSFDPLTATFKRGGWWSEVLNEAWLDQVDAMMRLGVPIIGSTSNPVRPKHQELSEAEQQEARTAAALRAQVSMYEASRPVIESSGVNTVDAGGDRLLGTDAAPASEAGASSRRRA
jgi:hypothetical protein